MNYLWALPAGEPTIWHTVREQLLEIMWVFNYDYEWAKQG
jgi:hypothetical protein